jgi:DNA polymerase I-like protein with 3'-5' exonuclease and polymerase domains
MPYALSIWTPQAEGRRYFEWEVDPKNRKVSIPERDRMEVREIFADPNVGKIFHNAPFDVQMIEVALKIPVRGPIHDTLVMASHANSLEPTKALKPLAALYVDIPNDDEEDLRKATIRARAEAKRRGWSRGDSVGSDYWLTSILFPSKGYVRRYCVRDTLRTWKLFQFYREILTDVLGVWKQYMDEVPFHRCVINMMERGIRGRPEIAANAAEYFGKIQRDALGKINRIWPKRLPLFNHNSSKDVQHLLRNVVGLPIGQTTDRATLSQYLDEPLVMEVLQARTATKAVSGMFGQFMRHTTLNRAGRYWVTHCNYQPCGATTGRMTCYEPNLQQVAGPKSLSILKIPARDFFAPRPGWVLYSMDWVQIEVCIFAHLSKEPKMCKAIREGRDFHTEVGNKLWGGEGNERGIRWALFLLEIVKGGRIDRPSAEVLAAWERLGIDRRYLRNMTQKERERKARDWLESFDWRTVDAENSLGKKPVRTRAKNSFFARLYGGGPYAIMRQTGCSYEEARGFLDDVAKEYPRVESFIRESRREGERNGYVTTFDGRRLTVLRDKAYRACNYKVQGSAARLLKLKIVEVEKYLSRFGGRLLLAVHDEILPELRITDATRERLLGLKRIMEDCPYFDVPIRTKLARITQDWSRETEIQW